MKGSPMGYVLLAAYIICVAGVVVAVITLVLLLARCAGGA